VPSAKDEILAHLKRSSCTVDGLANAMGLARMTVRQHLIALERDGLVGSREERQRTGRPHLLFSLTDRGHEIFPKRYDRLADLVLQEVASLDSDEIAGLSPQQKKQLLLRKMAQRLYLQYEDRVAGKNLPERVAAAAQILQEESGFAEWRAGDLGYEIIDYNCIYRRVADLHGDLCDLHLTLLSRLLGQEVECKQLASHGAECCRFVVRGEAAGR